MKTWVCSVCGYVYEGETAPEKCPVCKASSDKFVEQSGELTWAAEHVIGVAKDVSEDIKKDLRANFEGECCEVGMYLAMSRAAYREGYPEVGDYYRQAAFEEADHASRFAELLGEVVSPSTKENLIARVKAENGATVRLILRRELRLRIWMLSTILFMRWLVTRLDTVRHSRVC